LWLRITRCFTIEQRIVSDAEAAGAAAEQMRGGVVLKAIAPGLVHKTEAGAVRLHLNGVEAARTAAREMSNRLSSLGHPPTGFVVQRMAKSGVDVGWRGSRPAVLVQW